jgi:hypothetical protein
MKITFSAADLKGGRRDVVHCR